MKLFTGVLVIAVLSCFIFAGCATVPKEDLDKKDAVINDLNARIETLRQDIGKLNEENNALMGENTRLQNKLKEKQAAQKALQQKMKESTIK